MPTSYPTTNDVFGVPNAPTTTPLSSGGSSTRAHTQLHDDVGAAVMALEANSALLTHDHSASGARATAKLTQANTHQSADTDNATTSLHHTLGTSATQAATGNHDHTTMVHKTAAETIAGVKTFSNPPNIADFTNATHGHNNNANGGTLNLGKGILSNVAFKTVFVDTDNKGFATFSHDAGFTPNAAVATINYPQSNPGGPNAIIVTCGQFTFTQATLRLWSDGDVVTGWQGFQIYVSILLWQ